jgi:hypothetical protein
LPDRDKSTLMRSVNEGIASFAADLEPGDPEVADHWSFVCECGAAGCVDWVGLELAEYAAIRARKDDVLAPGHALGSRALAKS